LMRAVVLAGCIAATIIAPANASEDEPIPPSAPVFDMEIALATGATDHLRAQSSSKTLIAYPSIAAYHRTRGALAKSDQWARQCIENPSVKAQPSSEALYHCLGILAGNQLWQGNISAWADTMIKVRRLGGNNPVFGNSALFLEAGISEAPFESFLGRPTLKVSKRPDGVVEVPVRYLRGWPIVSAKLTGGKGSKRDINIEFLIDTGATRSILSHNFAKSINLDVTPGFSKERREGQVRSTALVEPVNLTIGGIEIKDISFSDNDGIDINILGLDVIRQLGPVLLSDKVVRILGNAWKYTGCTTGLRVTSDPWGRYWNLRSPMKVDGIERLVMADTGMSGLLEVRGSREAQPAGAAWSNASVNTMFGRVDRRIRKQAVRLDGSGMNTNFEANVVEPVERPLEPESWILGGEALRTHNLLIAPNWGLMCWQKRDSE